VLAAEFSSDILCKMSVHVYKSVPATFAGIRMLGASHCAVACAMCCGSAMLNTEHNMLLCLYCCGYCSRVLLVVFVLGTVGLLSFYYKQL